jgi:nitrite reductase/ring-hydroxylating ferredoxin subunit
MTFARAARSSDVSGPRFLLAEVDGTSVLLTRLSDGTPVAFGRICPHQQNPMDDGVLWEDEIDCPFHHYTYDPRTGRNLFPARVFPAARAAEVEGIPVYPVKEEDGWVLVAPEPETPSESRQHGDG